MTEPKYCLIGAIAGDVIGSVHEYTHNQDASFKLFVPGSAFTDDTVMTVAIADAILNARGYAETLRDYGRRYPKAGYGGMFHRWLHSTLGAYNSFGNGSAMRVSPVGWAYQSMDEVLQHAEESAAVTHNHPEGIKGAQAVALAIYLARSGVQKSEMKRELAGRFGYNLERKLADIRKVYRWNETCQESVPESIIAFFEASDFETTVRNAISLGGDADTLAAIAGSIAEAYYGGVPGEILTEVHQRLTDDLWVAVEAFSQKFLA